MQSDQAAQGLKEFKDKVKSHVVMDISNEAELLIEIDDILDEIHILKTVLTDQKNVIEAMNKQLEQAAGKRHSLMLVETKAIDNCYARLEQMEKAAEKADTAVRFRIGIFSVLFSDLNVQLHRLIDLKQQQASLAEAYYARESAKDTASQGRTVLIFTVVTIIFCEPSICQRHVSSR